MAKAINGLWNVNVADVDFAYFDTTSAHPGAWLYQVRDGVQSWRRVPAADNAAAVRGVAAAYAATGGVRLDMRSSEYAAAIDEIGDVPQIVERGRVDVIAPEGDYEVGRTLLCADDGDRGWKLSRESGVTVVSRDISVLSPADYEEPSDEFDECATGEPVPVFNGHTIGEFANEFETIYGMLYEADSNGEPVDYEAAVAAFDNGEYPRNVLEAFNRYREDYVSSDREAAAFMMALESRTMQPDPVETAAGEVVEPEPVTAEIPEVPPQTDTTAKVVKVSAGVKVRVARKVVIPGGKSVRELADVFGAYAHKPRGFRDSKGRRVAYVAFDKSGGVIAYRDYYTLDGKVERDIAAYCKRFGLRLAA